MKILQLDSSITGKQSVSHTLSTEIVAALAASHMGAEVTYHDLANEPLLHLSPAIDQSVHSISRTPGLGTDDSGCSLLALPPRLHCGGEP